MIDHRTFKHFTLFLSKEDKLSLRSVNRDTLQSLQQLPGPYLNKVDFIIAISFWFRGCKSKEELYPLLEDAWKLYSTTVFSKNLKPTVFYKLRDSQYEKKLNNFAEGEDLTLSGQKYDPTDHHTWEKNAIWLLAQIHCHKTIALLTEITTKNGYMMRENYPKEFSALAKEIACMLNAGWKPILNQDLAIQLLPNKNKNIKKLNIHEIDNLEYAKIIAAVKQIEDLIAYRENIYKALTNYQVTFEKYATNYAELVAKDNLTQSVDKLITSSLRVLGNTEYFATFIHLANMSASAYVPKLKEKEAFQSTAEFVEQCTTSIRTYLCEKAIEHQSKLDNEAADLAKNSSPCIII